MKDPSTTIEDFQFNISSGSTEELFKKFESIIPLSTSVESKFSMSGPKQPLNDEVFQIIMNLDRTVLIENVTKYLYCGFISYDPEKLTGMFGTGKLFNKDQITPLLMVILSIGILYKPDLSKQDFSYALRIYQESCDMTSLFFDNISVDNVEILALNSWFLRALNQKQSSMVISSMSIQIAAVLGLHQLKETDDSERKKKVWWATYSINRFFSVRSGFTNYLRKSSVKTPYPKWLNIPAKDAVMIQRTYDLALIAEDINEFYLNRENAGDYIIDRIMGMLQSLIKWKESSPFFSESSDLSRSLSSVHLNYSHLIQLTTIPVLLHLTLQQLSGKQVSLTSRMLSIISICQKSALLSINILTHMSKDSIANFGVFDVEYISTSTLIVGMISVLNMNTEGFETLKSSIGLLEDIKKFGSPYASENYVKLVKFLTATKAFVEKKSNNKAMSPLNIETYSIPSSASPDYQQDDMQLWETIYHDITLDMNSNWEEFVGSL